MSFSDQRVPQLLSSRRLLEELTGKGSKWLAVPNLLCDNLVCTHSATTTPEALYESGMTRQALQMAWQKRHECMRAPPVPAQSPVVHYQPCRLGLCVCRSENYIRILSRKLSAFLRLLVKESVVGGSYVLSWEQKKWVHPDPDVQASLSATSSLDEEAAEAMGGLCVVERSYTHICACNLKPFRATLCEMEPETAVMPDSDVLVLKQVHSAEGAPKTHSMYEWFHKCFDPSTQYKVAAHLLSCRESPVMDFHGQAIIVQRPVREENIWLGTEELEKKTKRSTRAPLHERLQRPATRSQSSAANQRAGEDDDEWEDLNMQVDDAGGWSGRVSASLGGGICCSRSRGRRSSGQSFIILVQQQH